MTFGRKRNGQPRNCWRRWRVDNVHELSVALRNNIPLFTEQQIIRYTKSEQRTSKTRRIRTRKS